MPNSFKVQVAEIIRDTSHNLVIHESNELDNEIYFTRVQYFIGLLEGSRNEAYLDGIPKSPNSAEYMSAAKFYSLPQEEQNKLKARCRNKTKKSPITTVGIGANIEMQEVRDRFDKILGEPDLMDLVHKGKANLEDKQVSIIFKDCVKERLSELYKIYGADWKKLRVNEQIAILSLYFNLPSLAGRRTNFCKHIKNYIQTNDEIHLRRAVEEVEKKSNLNGDKGIQNRRNAEGALLASYNSPTYTKPNDAPDIAKIKIAEINKTIIPLSDDSSVDAINSDYFVWRTQMDNKVREEHILFEGKIFRKDNPPKYMPSTMHNCRCHPEEVPDHILIKNEITEKRAFELYLRKGIIHPILST